jgi:predicted Ser/Thr protein kinase
MVGISTILTIVLAITKTIASSVIDWIKGKKTIEMETGAEAAKASLKSVEEAYKLDDKIEDKHEEIKNEEKDVTDEDGGLNFDSWNNTSN